VIDRQGVRLGTRWHPLLLAVLSSLAIAFGASADMVLSDIIVDLQAPDEMRHDIEVWNSGTEPLYIEIETSEVIDPGGDESLRQTLDDPRTAGLLASPKRLVVLPDERKRVRLAARKMPTDRDLVYRVGFIPKENKAESTQALAFKVLIGYEVLVLIRPPGGRPQLVVTREGNELHFENKGQSSVLVRKLESCPTPDQIADADGEKGCVDLVGNRLYAGERWDVTVPLDGPVRSFESYRSENRISEY